MSYALRLRPRPARRPTTACVGCGPPYSIATSQTDRRPRTDATEALIRVLHLLASQEGVERLVADRAMQTRIRNTFPYIWSLLVSPTLSVTPYAPVLFDFPSPRSLRSQWRKLGIAIPITRHLTDVKLHATPLDKGLARAFVHPGRRMLRIVSRDTGCITQVEQTGLCGSGAHSFVYNARLIQTAFNGEVLVRNDVVIKRITDPGVNHRDVLVEMIVHGAVSQILGPKTAPQLLHVCIDNEGGPCLIMTRMESDTNSGMSLYDYIFSGKATTADMTRVCSQTLVKLAPIIHKLQTHLEFIHSDLHMGNIYIHMDTHENVVDVGILDFGLSSCRLPFDNATNHTTERIGIMDAFVTHFQPGLDLAFLAFTFLLSCSEIFEPWFTDVLRHMCTPADDPYAGSLFDVDVLKGTDDWSPVLHALNSHAMDYGTPLAVTDALATSTPC